MATETTASAKPKPTQPTEDERFRFIGFGVFPKRASKFWKSESEQKQYEQKVKTGIGSAVMRREDSLLSQEVMTMVDRVVLTVVGLILIATAMMPWVGYRTAQGSDFSLFWGAVLGVLAGNIGTAFAGGFAVGVSAILALIMLIGAPLIGIWVIASVWMKSKTPEAYLMRLRLPLKIGYAFFYAGLAIFILSFIGGHIPGFQSWNLIEPGEKYGIGTLLSIMSFGPYVVMAMGMVAGVKSGEL